VTTRQHHGLIEDPGTGEFAFGHDFGLALISPCHQSLTRTNGRAFFSGTKEVWIMESAQKLSSSAGFSVMEYGGLEDWSAFQLPHPRFGVVPGKHFLRSELGLTGIEISLNSIAPGKGVPFLHGHRQNEELYLFLSGEGQMLLDGEVVKVKAGTAVRVAPPVLRSWRNTGAEQLTCVVIQAREGTLQQATATDGFISEAAPSWPALP
jgi:uncharacterized cupin superfamily protein